MVFFLVVFCWKTEGACHRRGRSWRLDLFWRKFDQVCDGLSNEKRLCKALNFPNHSLSTTGRRTMFQHVEVETVIRLQLGLVGEVLL